MKKHLIALAMTILSAGAISVSATVESDRLTDVLAASVEQGISVGSVKVKSVTINSKARKITVKCNEPTSYLPFTQDYVTKLKKDMAILMVEQYLEFVLEVSDKCYVMEKGRISMSGPTETLDKRKLQTLLSM